MIAYCKMPTTPDHHYEMYFHVMQTQTMIAYFIVLSTLDHYVYNRFLTQLTLNTIRALPILDHTTPIITCMYYIRFFSSRAISSMLFTLFWPIIPWLLQLIVFSWFVVVGVYPFA